MSELQTQPATDVRAPCTECGASMEGEHHKRKVCSGCKPPAGRRTREQPSGRRESITDMTERQVAPSRVGAVKVKIEDLPPVDDDWGEEHEYWVGTVEGFPIQNVTVGGITFPRFCGTPSFEWDEKKKEMVADQPIIPGALVKLTDRQVDFIADDVRKYIVRPIGKDGKRVTLLDRAKRENGKLVPDEHYSAQRGDVPLAKYIYMIRTDTMGVRDRSKPPETMLQE